LRRVAPAGLGDRISSDPLTVLLELSRMADRLVESREAAGVFTRYGFVVRAAS